MNLRCFLLPLIFCFSMNSVAYADNDNMSEQQIIDKMGGIIKQLDLGNSPWPEFNIKANPIIVTFANQHNYAYFFSPKNSDWVKISDQPTTFYLNNDEYHIDQLGWSFGNMVDGQVGLIFNFDSLPVYNFETLHSLFHERFHFFEFDTFSTELYNWKIYDGFNNLENVKLTLIEDAALINYLNTHNIEDLKNYVAINQYREKLIGEESSFYETAKENIEGLADYYGWNVVSDGTSVKLNDLIITNYKKQCDLNHLITCQLQRRYYFTGTVIAIALNELDKNSWRDKLVKDKISLRTQLFRYFNLSQSEIENRLNQSKTMYHYDEISQPIENVILEYKTQRSKEIAAYQQSKDIILNIESRPCNLFGVIYIDKTYYLDSANWLDIGVRGNSVCPDKSVMVNYLHTPYVFKTEHTGRIQVKIAPDTMIAIDGNSLSANEFINNKDYNFTNLYLKTDSIEIKVSNRSGKLIMNNGSISLITTNPEG